MKCIFCKDGDTKVTDTRSMEDNTSIRRRRLCEKCGERFTTYEKVDIIALSVVKRDLTREKFDRNKLLNGILLACNKRPISTPEIENLVTSIENNIYTTTKKEISSKLVGELVMEELKRLDPIAYIRFASVYREFKDIGSFIDEVHREFNPRLI